MAFPLEHLFRGVRSPSTMPYELCPSRRARRARVEIHAGGKVKVIVPQGSDVKRIARWLETKKSWIEKTRERLRVLPETAPENPAIPDSVELRAVAQTWRVEFAAARVKRPRLTQSGPFQLTFVVPAETPVSRKLLLLRRWVQSQAEDYLPAWLEKTAAETGLAYARASVRAQKTRWGSCSARKAISLNRKLLFLPPRLVRYILVHELCHTAHLDHSRHFWKRVASFEPGWKDLQRDMRSAGRYVPGWHG
ncbi:MAG TPA: SprT family zinc-dependent metalloprotease [Verrucomicrobiae bacterium]|nr:SprT family zinc-dependent metalloprotease [Verrucomicrobiae bacterium]